MTPSEIIKKYISFFEKRGHKRIQNSPLIPENDPTTLFTSAGMQPLVPYLLGERHPQGKRLVNVQNCFRAADLDEIGDNRHTTFFRMLGNWSLGDYFKGEQLTWVFEFFTQELNLAKEKLHVSVFEGDENIPKDSESFNIWKSLGIDEAHIHFYSADKNWWSLSGSPEKMKEGEIGGPDSEVFYEFTTVKHDAKYGDSCHPNCDCGRFLEIGNSVFIQYQKQIDGSLKELPNKNVDFGGGLERLVAATNDNPDIFQTDLYLPLIDQLSTLLGVNYQGDSKIALRIIVDHIKAAGSLIKNDVIPSNKLQGYLLRRLIRRAAVQIRLITGNTEDIFKLEQLDPEINIGDELQKFSNTLDRGLKELASFKSIDGKVAFDLYQSFGFPFELTEELARKKGLKINRDQFKDQFEKHQELSRTASSGMFKGGLESTGEKEIKYHTCTHLLHQALRTILGNEVIQRGSNITPERMRFDFSYSDKLTEEQLKEVEQLVNQKIKEDLHVTHTEMLKDEAEKTGAIHAFGAKYGDKVTVYSVGDFSKEFCGGPHVEHTNVLGQFQIIKQESAGAGIRRIYANLS